jgi:hypothetical protein
MDALGLNHVTEVGADYSGRRLASLSVRGSRFERCRFDRMRAKAVAFSTGYDLTEYLDCTFDGARFPSVIAGFSRFVRCSFRDVDINGLGDDYLELVDCVFTGTLRSTVFRGCTAAAVGGEALPIFADVLRPGRPSGAGRVPEAGAARVERVPRQRLLRRRADRRVVPRHRPHGAAAAGRRRLPLPARRRGGDRPCPAARR